MAKRVCYVHVGPFTVTVAHEVLRSIADSSKPLTWLQAEQCQRELAMYLEKEGVVDSGYCGLSTALARRIERELQSDNDSFAQSVWGRAWADIFAADVAAEFTPNDFDVSRPDWFTARRLRRAIRRMTALAHEILSDPGPRRGSILERLAASKRIGFKRVARELPQEKILKEHMG